MATGISDETVKSFIREHLPVFENYEPVALAVKQKLGEPSTTESDINDLKNPYSPLVMAIYAFVVETFVKEQIDALNRHLAFLELQRSEFVMPESKNIFPEPEERSIIIARTRLLLDPDEKKDDSIIQLLAIIGKLKSEIVQLRRDQRNQINAALPTEFIDTYGRLTPQKQMAISHAFVQTSDNIEKLVTQGLITPNQAGKTQQDVRNELKFAAVMMNNTDGNLKPSDVAKLANAKVGENGPPVFRYFANKEEMIVEKQGQLRGYEQQLRGKMIEAHVNNQLIEQIAKNDPQFLQVNSPEELVQRLGHTYDVVSEGKTQGMAQATFEVKLGAMLKGMLPEARETFDRQVDTIKANMLRDPSTMNNRVLFGALSAMENVPSPSAKKAEEEQARQAQRTFRPQIGPGPQT